MAAAANQGTIEHMQATDSTRVRALRDAETKAQALFGQVVARGLIVPGVGERQLSDQIRDLAAELFGTRRFWHKRIVRAGEADFGRTYVLGDDPAKHRLADDLPRIWEAGRAHFDSRPDITGAQLFSYVSGLIAAAGWGHATEHAGHLVGEFPHERINGDELESYIAPANVNPMRRLDAAGQDCHWILEVHLVDRERGFGGFFEQLLDIPTD